MNSSLKNRDENEQENRKNDLAQALLWNTCSWGPIGSLAYSLNDRFSIISEWFGYSYGAGFSIRPFEENSLSISLFATDFIKGFPKYAEDHCTGGMCEARFYGSMSLNF